MIDYIFQDKDALTLEDFHSLTKSKTSELLVGVSGAI